VFLCSLVNGFLPTPTEGHITWAANMTFWGVLLCCLLTPAAGHQTRERLPFFHGHVFENSPPASKVNGLGIPVRRIDAQKWCPVSGLHFKLYGNGSDDFRAFAHHKRGNIMLKTSRVLDREARSEYLLRLGLCCQTCASDSAVFEVASVKVDVLDTNDHEPSFRGADAVYLTLDDTTALRSAVYRLQAVDADSGNNAELTYISVPKNGSFYVVPKTGEVLLVDSILGLPSKVTFYVFARDHGWPPLTSKGVVVTVAPQRWVTCPAQLAGSARGARSPRALIDPGSPVVSLNVSEDASIGSVITSLSPARFPSAAYELVHPESSSVTVGRDSGDITISRKLDRETEPFLELTVKIQDKRGVYYSSANLHLSEVMYPLPPPPPSPISPGIICIVGMMPYYF